MTEISKYFLNKLEKDNINLSQQKFSDITEHLWSQDDLSTKIRMFINTNTRKKPSIYEVDKELILSMLPGIKVDFEYEGINFITIEDIIKNSTGMTMEEFGLKYAKQKDQIWVAYWGLTVKDKLFPIAGFMTNELYLNFEDKINYIDYKQN